MLKNLKLETTYYKTRHEIYEEFYKPCMENSVYYDRISGYFGSSIFIVINESLLKFVKNGGKIRIITSPILTNEDLTAIFDGYKIKNEKLLSEKIEKAFEELSNQLPKATELLKVLIANGIVDIKLAQFGENPQAKRLMHDKAGIFTDRIGNSVAFRGSFNETFKGLSQYGNGESFDVFTNWFHPIDKERVDNIKNQFNSMWGENEPNIITYSLPETNIEKIKSMQVKKDLSELIDEVSIELNGKRSKWFAEETPNRRTIRRHQEEVLNNWENNSRKGLFEMSTGSGKTFTALCAIRESIFEKNEIPIIIVPSKLLFEQWSKELYNIFGNKVSLLKVGSGHLLDKSKLDLYTKENIDIKRCILTTYQTSSKESFINSINWSEKIFLVCDEVHNIGSPKYQNLLENKVGPRIGLSATPKRYNEEENKKILGYFDKIIEPRYSISDAIKDKVLCEYFYEVFEVSLLEEEQEEWLKLTNQINKKYAISKSNDSDFNIKGFEMLLFKRADIIKKAKNKIEIAEKILNEKYKADQRWLVYLDDTEQVVELKKRLERNKLLKGNIFEYHTNAENSLEETIKHFEYNGAILLSINCLDEGVDIPAIDNAIILSSSKNPRQYIQRRGRVLRTSKNKNFAYIYDCIVLPKTSDDRQDKFLSIVKGEVARSLEFSKNARNSYIVESKILQMMTKSNISETDKEVGEDD